jgi:transposase
MEAKKSGRRKKGQFMLMHPNAAGIDIGSKIHVVAVPSDRDQEPVRTFKTFTGELYRLADWLKNIGIETVAMESTGVYWLPLFEILQSRGIDVLLTNARDAKQVPGRKTDVNDAQWLMQLHQYGLLRGSFQPSEQIGVLRAYMRQRERLLEYAASHIQHMQKALMHMNVQLHHVVSDITGATGMRIIRSILSGNTNPAELARHRDVRCKASESIIIEALTGNYRPEHLFALRQAVEIYDRYQLSVAACDKEIETVLQTLRHSTTPENPLPKPRHRTRQPNAPSFNVREAMYAVVGVDLTQIHGLGTYLALKLISECGTDMSRWPTVKHFTSWLCLAPGNKISGGKVLSSRTRRSSNRATALLRLAAVNVGKTGTAMGAFYRRLSARIGKAKAVTATARKIAAMFYKVLRYGETSCDPGEDYYEERYRQRVVKNLERRAKQFGLTLMPTSAPMPEVS